MSDFINYYMDWRELAEKTLASEVKNAFSREAYAGVAVTGMGGSGIVGDVLQVISWRDLRIPLVVIKDFKLPKFVSREWLVLSISYSGNTVETLSTVKEALDRGCDVAAVSSNGRLISLAVEKGLTHVVVEGGRAPRATFPALLLAALKVLKVKGIDLGGPTEEGLRRLGRTDEALKAGEKLSEGLEKSIPVFISDVEHAPLAVRGKNEFNENAKMVAKVEVLPEWGHNDIVGWESWFGNFTAIVLIPKDSGEGLMRFAASYLREAGVNVKEVVMAEDNYIDRVLWHSLVIGIASLKTAERRGVEPGVTKSISKYKSFIKSVTSS